MLCSAVQCTVMLCCVVLYNTVTCAMVWSRPEEVLGEGEAAKLANRQKVPPIDAGKNFTGRRKSGSIEII